MSSSVSPIGGAGAPLAELTTAASAPAPAAAPAYVCIKRVGHAAFADDVFAEVACLPGDSVMRLAERASVKFQHWGVNAAQVRLYLALAGGYIAPTPTDIDAVLGDESRRLDEGMPLTDAGVLQGSWLLARVPLPAAAAGPAAVGLLDLLVASGLRREHVRVQVLRRVAIRFGGALACLHMAGSLESTVAADIYAMAASLPSLTTEAAFLLEGLETKGPLCEGSPITLCYRQCDEMVEEMVLKPLDAREHHRALGLQEALAKAAPATIPGLTTFELRPRTDKYFMLMPRYGATLEHVSALRAQLALVLWRRVAGALRGLHALGFAHMDVKPSNICLAGREGFVLVDIGSVVPFNEATSMTPAYVARGFPHAMRTSSATADWWQFGMTLAEKACGAHCLAVGACAVPTVGALFARLREHLPATVWVELEPLLDFDEASGFVRDPLSSGGGARSLV